uniref:Uncharacterized protein n=1 Tax=Tetraodon nigroviridis TaxID=99883 RepID=H3CK95_TETNG
FCQLSLHLFNVLSFSGRFPVIFLGLAFFVCEGFLFSNSSFSLILSLLLLQLPLFHFLLFLSLHLHFHLLLLLQVQLSLFSQRLPFQFLALVFLFVPQSFFHHSLLVFLSHQLQLFFQVLFPPLVSSFLPPFSLFHSLF